MLCVIRVLSVWPVGSFCSIDKKQHLYQITKTHLQYWQLKNKAKVENCVQQVVLIFILWCFAFIGYLTKTKVCILSCGLEFGVWNLEFVVVWNLEVWVVVKAAFCAVCC